MDPITQDPNQPSAQAPLVVSQTMPAGDPPPVQGKNVIMSSRAFKDRLDKAKSHGQSAYQAELDSQAVAKGFANHAALMAHVDSIITRTPVKTGKPNGQAPQRPQPPAGQPSGQTSARTSDHRAAGPADRRVQQLEREKKQLAEERERERKSRRKAERERDAIEARSNLERIAGGVGIKKLSQAILLYEETCRGKTEDELGKMDEVKFFEGLRATDSYLFGETVVPATTGTSGAPPGSHVPRPSATAAAAGDAGTVDVSKMNKAQYVEFKRGQSWSRPTAAGGRAS